MAYAYNKLSASLLLYLALCIPNVFAAPAKSADAPQQTNINYALSFTDTTHEYYYLALLNMALKATENNYGKASLIAHDTPMNIKRKLIRLREGKIDILWNMTTDELEDNYQAVRFPLLKGYIGHRVFIIEHNQQDKFNALQSTLDISSLTAVQGFAWPDTDILKANGFNVEGVDAHNSFESYLLLVSRGICDYFPRSIMEAQTELDESHYKNLTVERKHMLIYPAYMYFFTSKENTLLANRILDGLTALKDSGEFDKFFVNFPRHKRAMEYLNMEQRKRHYLDNPFLSYKLSVD